MRSSLALRAAERSSRSSPTGSCSAGASRRSETSSPADWVLANYRFHDVIYAAAQVPFVEAVAKSARRTFLSRWRAGGPEIDDLYEQNKREHRAILGAIEARSAEGARALAHEHVLALVPAARGDPRPRRSERRLRRWRRGPG